MKQLAIALLCIVAMAGVLAAAGCGSDGGHDSDGPQDTSSESDSGENLEDECKALLLESNKLKSTVGCVFYPVDLRNLELEIPDNFVYAIVAANIWSKQTATVTLFEKTGYGWKQFRQEEIGPMSLHMFKPPAKRTDGSGLHRGNAFKLVADIPIVAYQLDSVNPIATADGSTLIPLSSLGNHYQVIGPDHQEVNEQLFSAYFAVVASKDNTEVTITPSEVPLAAPGVKATTEPFTVNMNEGDVLYVDTRVHKGNLTGSIVETDDDYPVAVFTGHECTTLPEDVMACDHLEDQLPAVDFWGSQFIASHLPARYADNPRDTVKWQIYAAEDDTTVRLTAPDGIELPFTEKKMSAGESVEFFTESIPGNPGDFYIESVPLEVDNVDVQKPIAVMQYMVGGNYYTVAEELGDPAMVYMSPIKQFLNEYIILVPEGWDFDNLVITKPVGTTVKVSGEEVPQSLFNDVAGTTYQVARYPVDDGVHIVESDGADIAVVVIGWRPYDSYAYVGGMGMKPKII